MKEGDGRRARKTTLGNWGVTARRRLGTPRRAGPTGSEAGSGEHPKAGLPAPAGTSAARGLRGRGAEPARPNERKPRRGPSSSLAGRGGVSRSVAGPPFPARAGAGRGRVSTCCLSLRAKFPSPGPRASRPVCVTSGHRWREADLVLKPSNLQIGRRISLLSLQPLPWTFPSPGTLCPEGGAAGCGSLQKPWPKLPN